MMWPTITVQRGCAAVKSPDVNFGATSRRTRRAAEARISRVGERLPQLKLVKSLDVRNHNVVDLRYVLRRQALI
jgi:hypothetical protein